MTWPEFMASDLTLEDYIAQEVAASMAAHEAARRAATEPTVEQQLQQRLDAARLRELVTQEALLADVRPSAVRFVVRDAEEQFALQDDALVPRHGQTDPGDPLRPLSPRVWLAQLAQSAPALFAAPVRVQ